MHCISQCNEDINLCWCLQHHRICLAPNCIQLLLTFIAIMGKNFSHVVLYGFFLPLKSVNLYQANQIRNPFFVITKTLSKLTLREILLKRGLTSYHSATQSDTRVSTAGETEDVVSSQNKNKQMSWHNCHGCMTVIIFCYATSSTKSQIWQSVCIWHGFILASLVGHLLMYN